MTSSPLATFLDPAVETQMRADGTRVLRSPHALEPHPSHTLAWLRRWAAERPAQDAFAQRGRDGRWRRVDWGEAHDAVRRLASALLAQGAGPSRPLMVLSENSVELALMSWAAMYAGVPLAPVSPPYSLAPGAHARLQGVAALVEPWLVFAQDGGRYAAALKALEMPAQRTITVDAVPAGGLSFEHLRAGSADAGIDALHDALGPDTLAKVMFTSGSTGVPKGVAMSHRMLAAAQQITAQAVVRRPDRPMVQVDWLPWHHVMGGNVVLGRLLRFGGTLYIDDGKPLPEHFGRTLANLREVAPTYYFNVPAGYAMLVDALERDAGFARHFLGTLEFAYFSGAALPQDVHDRFQRVAERTVGRRVVIGTAYAATETTAAVAMRTWEAANAACIGLPLPGCELKLVPDPAMPGRYELRVRGPNVFREYVGRPGLAAASFDDEGYYRPGDAVRFVDEHSPTAGLLFGGRFAEDFKLSNGTWVRSAALRARLLECAAPLVKDAVVVGEGQAHVGALAWLDGEACRRTLGLPGAVDDAHLSSHPAVRRALGEALGKANGARDGASMRIERLGIETAPPSLEGYELTDKGSLNARAVCERRPAAIAALFAETAAPSIVAAPAAVSAKLVHRPLEEPRACGRLQSPPKPSATTSITSLACDRRLGVVRGLVEGCDGIALLRHVLGLPPQVQTLLRGSVPPLCARRARRGGGRSPEQLSAHRRSPSRADDLPRPGPSAGQRPRSRKRPGASCCRVASRCSTRCAKQVTYPVIGAFTTDTAQGGIKVIVQTTGDLLTEAIIEDLLERGTYMISVASIDEFHVGIDTAARQEAFIGKLSRMFEAAGVRRSGLSAPTRNWHEEEGPLYSFFGAAPDTWIGKIWPRGRAWQNDLSQGRHHRQLLQPMVRRARVSEPRLQRLGGVDRARRRGVPLLRQDQAADRQPARRTVDRDPRFPRR